MNMIKGLLFFLFIGTFDITANPTRHTPADSEYPIVTVTHKTSAVDGIPAGMGILTVEKDANDINNQAPVPTETIPDASVHIGYPNIGLLRSFKITERELETVECETEYADHKSTLVVHYFSNPDSKYIDITTLERDESGRESFLGMGMVRPDQQRAIFKFNDIELFFDRSPIAEELRNIINENREPTDEEIQKMNKKMEQNEHS
jgi:hypothetical protein